LQVGKSAREFEDDEGAEFLAWCCSGVCQLTVKALFFFVREQYLLEILHDFTAAAEWGLAERVSSLCRRCVLERRCG